MENISLILGQQLLNGIVLGTLYGLIAIGYSLVYGILSMINFAHSNLYMLAAYLTAIFLALLQFFNLSHLSVTLFLTFFLTLIVVAGYAIAIEHIAYRPLRRAARLTPLISAIGASMILENFVRLTQGARAQSIPSLFQGHVGPLSYSALLILIVATLSMGVLHFFIKYTSLGCAMRATQQDRIMTEMLGINTNKIITLCFFIGGAMAAIAGGLVALHYGSFDPNIGFVIGIKAFASAVLGGIGSVTGAMLGGLLLGSAESLFAGWVVSDYKDVFALSLLIIVLIVKPHGLLGKRDVEKI